MAGCYGNSAEDRYYEAMLDKWLDEQDADQRLREAVEAVIDDEIKNHSQHWLDWLGENKDEVLDKDENPDVDLMLAYKHTDEDYEAYLDFRWESVVDGLGD